MPESFRRAHTDEQRKIRSEVILDTTRRMLATMRVPDLSLNAIAREVGLAKSNVLRYFHSREAILLSLLTTEYTTWVTNVTATANDCTSPEALAAVLAQKACAQPLFPPLLSELTNTLEHNITVDDVVNFKTQILHQVKTLTDFVHETCPELSECPDLPLIAGIHAHICYAWGVGHPAPTLVQASATNSAIPSHAGQQEDIMRELITAHLRGLSAPPTRRDGAN